MLSEQQTHSTMEKLQPLYEYIMYSLHPKLLVTLAFIDS